MSQIIISADGVGSLTLDGAAYEGFGFSATTFLKPAPNATTFTSKKTDHGNFTAQNVRRGVRTVGITGWWVGDGDRMAMFAAREQLGLFGETHATVRLIDEGVDQFVVGILDVDPDDGGKDDYFVFTMTLDCEEPRRYSTALQTVYLQGQAAHGALEYQVEYPIDYGESSLQGNTGILVNAGNAVAYPVLTVHGDHASGVTLLDNTGRAITYTGQILASSPVTLDCFRRAALVNGIARDDLSSRDWFSIPAGGSLAVSFLPAEGTSGWVEATVRDTYL